jgi:hypothetical protein
MTCREPDLEVAVQCAWCGRIRAERGGFEREGPGPPLEADRSHGICASCLRRELRLLEDAGFLD